MRLRVFISSFEEKLRRMDDEAETKAAFFFLYCRCSFTLTGVKFGTVDQTQVERTYVIVKLPFVYYT